MLRQKRIVVVRQLGGIGDVLSMSCVYRGLREKYPKHKICLATGDVYLSGALTDIASHNPFVDEIHAIEPYECTTRQTKKVWHQYYGKVPHTLDDLPWYQKADIQIDLNTACVDYEWPAMHTDEGIVKPRYQVWCDHAGVVPSTYFPVYNITKAERVEAAEFYHERGWDANEIVAVGATSCDKKRAIGRGMLLTLCEGIKRNGMRPVIIDPSFKLDGYDAINGQRISKLMPLIEKVRVAVSVDSGLLHMAGALKVPVVGIFGPTDQEMRMRLYKGSAIDSRKLVACAPCWYTYHCMKDLNPARHFECLNKIDPNMVIEEVRRWAEKGSTLTQLPVYTGK